MVFSDPHACRSNTLEQFQSDLEMLLEGAGAKLGAVVESYKFHTPNTGDITTPYHLKVTLAPGC